MLPVSSRRSSPRTMSPSWRRWRTATRSASTARRAPWAPSWSSRRCTPRYRRTSPPSRRGSPSPSCAAPCPRPTAGPRPPLRSSWPRASSPPARPRPRGRSSTVCSTRCARPSRRGTRNGERRTGPSTRRSARCRGRPSRIPTRCQSTSRRRASSGPSWRSCGGSRPWIRTRTPRQVTRGSSRRAHCSRTGAWISASRSSSRASPSCARRPSGIRP
mmetsp:Transcript_129891/g.376081  ORF Transcript_129891/g.376081 Transcript_129891/m.376081 type:complete len:216 (-) Transcript_129891:1044-1691(-)